MITFITVALTIKIIFIINCPTTTNNNIHISIPS